MDDRIARPRIGPSGVDCQDGALLIVNDRPDIALASNADGVHLGQDDMPVAAVRRILPPSMIVGASVGTVSEAARAEEEGASYVALSGVQHGLRATRGSRRGLEMLSRMKDAVSIRWWPSEDR